MVVVGDLADPEERAEACDLIITHTHGRQAAARFCIPLYRAGFPVFDRLDAAYQVRIGCMCTYKLILDIANLLIAHANAVHPIDHPTCHAAVLTSAAH